MAIFYPMQTGASVSAKIGQVFIPMDCLLQESLQILIPAEMVDQSMHLPISRCNRSR